MNEFLQPEFLNLFFAYFMTYYFKYVMVPLAFGSVIFAVFSSGGTSSRNTTPFNPFSVKIGA